jgi:NAD(P)-dependent dehydrogenase (short-subunit alcohol dehydrogenase family)
MLTSALTDRKVVLITGCSSGIGHACAQLLTTQGYWVFASARNPKDVAALRAAGHHSLRLDLADSDSIKSAVEHIKAQTNDRIDVLFNNAGFGQPGAVEDLSRAAMRYQFETNVFGTMELTNTVLPIMRAQGSGQIIQNSSVLGLVSMAFRGAYNASKYALEGFSDTLRLELDGTGIQVSLIEPGPVSSQFRYNAYQNFMQNIDRINSPFADIYQVTEQRLANHHGPDPQFTVPALKVAQLVLKILQARRPKARYYITLPTYILGSCKRLLSSYWLDRILLKIMRHERKAS